MKHFVVLASLVLASTSIITASTGASTLSAGPISGGGGGVAVFQAKAIAQIMNDISEREDIAAKYFSHTSTHIKSIEWLSWQNGTTKYLIHTDSNCLIRVETTATDDSGMSYATTWHDAICP
jgi:hypothetical protein